MDGHANMQTAPIRGCLMTQAPATTIIAGLWTCNWFAVLGVTNNCGMAILTVAILLCNSYYHAERRRQ